MHHVPVERGPGTKSRKRYLQVACTNLLIYYFLGDRDLAASSRDLTAGYLTLFRRGMTVGLPHVRRVPGAKSKQPPARTLL